MVETVADEKFETALGAPVLRSRPSPQEGPTWGEAIAGAVKDRNAHVLMQTVLNMSCEVASGNTDIASDMIFAASLLMKAPLPAYVEVAEDAFRVAAEKVTGWEVRLLAAEVMRHSERSEVCKNLYKTIVAQHPEGF